MGNFSTWNLQHNGVKSVHIHTHTRRQRHAAAEIFAFSPLTIHRKMCFISKLCVCVCRHAHGVCIVFARIYVKMENVQCHKKNTPEHTLHFSHWISILMTMIREFRTGFNTGTVNIAANVLRSLNKATPHSGRNYLCQSKQRLHTCQTLWAHF